MVDMPENQAKSNQTEETETLLVFFLYICSFLFGFFV